MERKNRKPGMYRRKLARPIVATYLRYLAVIQFARVATPESPSSSSPPPSHPFLACFSVHCFRNVHRELTIGGQRPFVVSPSASRQPEETQHLVQGYHTSTLLLNLLK
jgi:hypothetical protein